jgi:hypothetical protein
MVDDDAKLRRKEKILSWALLAVCIVSVILAIIALSRST